MKIGYGRIGAAFTTNGTFVDDPSVLVSGRPGETARVTTPSSGDLTISAVHTASIVPGWFAIFNTTFPEGTVYTLSISGNTYSGTIAKNPRGELLSIIMLPPGLAAAPTSSIDVAGLTASHQYDIGEYFVGKNIEIPILPDWGINQNDPTTVQRSVNQQPWIQRGVPYRTLNFSPAALIEGDMFGNGVTMPMDWEQLWAQLDRGRQALYVPRWSNPDGSTSQNLINRTAIFGTASVPPQSKHAAGPWFSTTSVTVEESPIPT